MTKILLILIVAAVIESIGIAILSGGLKEINARDGNLPPAQIARVIKDGACNGKILLGIALEAVFFGALLYMLSIRDVSFIWPLTSLGFIVTTLAAQFLLHEQVSLGRGPECCSSRWEPSSSATAKTPKSRMHRPPPPPTQHRSARSNSSSTAPNFRAAPMVWC